MFILCVGKEFRCANKANKKVRFGQSKSCIIFISTLFASVFMTSYINDPNNCEPISFATNRSFLDNS